MNDLYNSVGEATEQWRQRMRLEMEGPIEGMARDSMCLRIIKLFRVLFRRKDRLQ